MAVLSNDLIRQGAAGASTGYTIKNSIRFNDDDSAHMHRTPGSASSSRKKWTWSGWLKRGSLGHTGSSSGYHRFFNVKSDSNNYFIAGFLGDSSDAFNVTAREGGSEVLKFETSSKFRDVAAWYHIVMVFDSTHALGPERFRVYFNGVKEPTSLSTTPSEDVELVVLENVIHNIARDNHSGTTYYFDGYMAEIHLVDGYAYGPEYFGEFQEDTNIWIPKKYSGSYGTNGFYIKGSDSSSLGTDSSGQGNNLTTSGLATNDQKIDTPTNNQITFNPLNNQRDGGTPSNGNLDYVGPGTRTLISLTANIPSTGKWAIAFKVAQVSTNVGWQFGITKSTNTSFGDAAGSNEDIGASDGVRMDPSSSDLYLYDYTSSTGIDPSLPLSTSDEFWIAVDMATGKCFLGIYDASATSMKFVAADTGLDGNPATGDNPTTTISDMIGSNEYTFAVGSKQTSQHVYLQRSTDVSGTTPSGYTYFENVKDLI